MITLLYFEEYESKLSHALLARDDINLVILRTTKNMKFFSEDYLKMTEQYNVYISNYENDIKKEVQKFKNWCTEKNLKLDKFLNDSEYYLEYANNFARETGLNALSIDQIQKVRDKVYMKLGFNKANIKTIDFAPIQNKNDIFNFWKIHDFVPIIVKPRREMNSKGVYKIVKKEDIENIPYEIIPNKYMVELFCVGHEWSIESLVQYGKVLDSYLTYLPNSTIWASINNDLHAHMTYINEPNFLKINPKAYIQKIVDAFHLLDGTMTIEIFVMPNGEMFASELGWRLPGGRACENHSKSYGFDIWNCLIDIAIGKQLYLHYSNERKCVGTLNLPNIEGVVTHLTSKKELIAFNGVTECELYAEIGKYQRKRRVGTDCSGWLEVTGQDAYDVLKKMRTIHENYIIETEESYMRKLKK